MPERYLRYQATWHSMHGGWTFRLWNDNNLGWIPNRDLFDRADKIVPAHAVGQVRSDVARYAILERYGGLYVDYDTEALQSVDQALRGHDAFATAEDDRWVGNTYLAAVPNHPVMRALVERLPDHARRAQRMTRISSSGLSGPRYLTPIWREFGCHVDPAELWFPYSYRDVRRDTVPEDYGDAFAVHHWGHVRELLKKEHP